MTAGHICTDTVFATLQCYQRIYWLFEWVLGASFTGVKRPRPKADHWPPCSAELTNE